MITKKQADDIGRRFRNVLRKINEACIDRDIKKLDDDFWEDIFEVVEQAMDALKAEVNG